MSRRNGNNNGHVRQMPLAVVGSTWVDAPDMERVAYELINTEEITLGVLRNHSLAFEFRRGGKARDEIDIDKVSGAQVTPSSWLHRVGVDGRIWAFEWWWEKYPDHRAPVVLHQLLHFTVAAGRLKRDAGHTAADFDVVVRRYGAWSDGLQLIYRQLELFEQATAR